MEAASGGYTEVGRVLLDKGADVNAAPVPSSRDTALTIAADKGHYRFVELLLSRGAQVDVRNKKGNSSLWLAANGGHLDVVQLLHSAGADIDSQDNRKVSCLMSAFRQGHCEVVKWLVKHVTQFPSDTELTRFIATISDKDMIKKTHQCLEIIRVAKERQASEANKAASILLEELEQEKTREESKKTAAARKKEAKKENNKNKENVQKNTASLKSVTQNASKDRFPVELVIAEPQADQRPMLPTENRFTGAGPADVRLLGPEHATQTENSRQEAHSSLLLPPVAPDLSPPTSPSNQATAPTKHLSEPDTTGFTLVSKKQGWGSASMQPAKALSENKKDGCSRKTSAKNKINVPSAAMGRQRHCAGTIGPAPLGLPHHRQIGAAVKTEESKRQAAEKGGGQAGGQAAAGTAEPIKEQLQHLRDLSTENNLSYADILKKKPLPGFNNPLNKLKIRVKPKGQAVKKVPLGMCKEIERVNSLFKI